MRRARCPRCPGCRTQTAYHTRPRLGGAPVRGWLRGLLADLADDSLADVLSASGRRSRIPADSPSTAQLIVVGRPLPALTRDDRRSESTATGRRPGFRRLTLADDEGYGAKYALRLAANAVERQVLKGKTYGQPKKRQSTESKNSSTAGGSAGSGRTTRLVASFDWTVTAFDWAATSSDSVVVPFDLSSLLRPTRRPVRLRAPSGPRLLTYSVPRSVGRRVAASRETGVRRRAVQNSDVTRSRPSVSSVARIPWRSKMSRPVRKASKP